MSEALSSPFQTAGVDADHRRAADAQTPFARAEVTLQPIGADAVEAVALFLHDALNRRISPRTWAAAMRPGWPVEAPNLGFMLTVGSAIVGVQLAFYAERRIGGRSERFCNVAAFCVLPDYRGHAMRLVRAVLAQPGYTFTDLSPSGNVVALNQRLNFRPLDTATSLVTNLPWHDLSGRVRILTDRTAIEATLSGEDAALYRDHARAAAAHHLVAVRDGACCHVMFRRDRRKGLPLFATLLHVSDRTLFAAVARSVFGALSTRFGIVFTLVEHRVAGYRPAGSLRLASPRPRMFRSSHLEADQIDYLYSELVAVPW